jgi:tetratricopeptide (TPR) repeat protein
MPTCFVVMGFGKKTDFESGRTLDLDKSYHNVIKPAVKAAGLDCIRADEIVHAGVIDLPMYEQLLRADVVIADLSTNNKNAFYELGVRHALRPNTTLVISEDGIKTFPFDVNHVVVRRYHHLGEDIGYSEVERFRAELSEAIKELIKPDPERRPDSPVYTFLTQLSAPMERAAKAAAAAAAAVVSAAAGVRPSPPQTMSALMQAVDAAEKANNFGKAATLLGVIRDQVKEEADKQGRPEDPYIVQRLALAVYKSELPTRGEALNQARELLATLGPSSSNDTETLGLWGSVHKRLWLIERQVGDLDQAIRAHERGFYLRNDYYNGINLAFLLNVRAAEAGDLAERIADYVGARRIRREVLTICDRWLASNQPPAAGDPQATGEYETLRYWVLATRGEALFGLEDPAAAEALQTAYKLAPKDWMQQTTRKQIENLAGLLAQSPITRLAT